MKQNKVFAVCAVIIAITMVGCFNNPPLFPTDTDEPQPQPEAPDTLGWNIPSNAITVAEACAICAQLGAGGTTDSAYYVKGYISGLHSNNTSGITGSYHNAQFYMGDELNTNSIDPFIAYRVKGINNAAIDKLEYIQVGDYVVVYGKLTNYNGTYETVQNSNIWNSTNIAMKIAPYRRGELSVLQALDSLEYLAVGDTTNLLVRGYVTEARVDTVSGTAQCIITDGTYTLKAYDILSVLKKQFVSEEQLKHGDVITIDAYITKDIENNNEPNIVAGNVTRTTNQYGASDR